MDARAAGDARAQLPGASVDVTDGRRCRIAVSGGGGDKRTDPSRWSLKPLIASPIKSGITGRATQRGKAFRNTNAVDD